MEYKKVAGKLLADKRSDSQNYLKTCLLHGIQRITGIINYMGNQINTLYDNIRLRNFSIIETVNDKLKTFDRLNTSGTGTLSTILANRVSGLLACSLMAKKPGI